MIKEANESDVFDQKRWGLPIEAVNDLAERLRRIWVRFRSCFLTKTRDTSEYAYYYLRGILSMETKRNYANIARRVIDLTDDGQNLQQFMSDSPWSAQAVFEQIQVEICQRPELSGGMLTVDESGDKCAGDQKAGADANTWDGWAKWIWGRWASEWAITKTVYGRWSMPSCLCPKVGSMMIMPSCASVGIFPMIAQERPSPDWVWR